METQKARLLRSQKTDKWYEEFANTLDGRLDASLMDNLNVKKEIKINYDLFNNILNIKDMEIVCNPFGSDIGEMPAKMTNRDIVSGKIKALIGMELKRAFPWKVIAVNKEATTRKEKETFNKIKDYVINSIMLPIRQQIEQEYVAQMNNRELTEDEKIKIQKEIEEKTKSATPEEIKEYMQRDHQDTAEILAHQLLEYLISDLDLKRKFNDCFKHFLLSGEARMYMGAHNDKVLTWVVNPLMIKGDDSVDFLEDGEWAVCNYLMSANDIIKYLGEDISDEDAEIIYKSWGTTITPVEEDLFSQIDNGINFLQSNVAHCVWKAPRKIGFLDYLDEQGQIQTKTVDESYTLNKDFGDISISWDWILEVYETWKIKTPKPIYVRKRALPSQYKDLKNINYCKLPYYGVNSDNTNSVRTALMSRLKSFQYYYDLIAYKIDLLVASDKGKKVLMNIGAVPSTKDFSMEKWQYLFETTSFGWFDPQEEGNTHIDANTVAKVVDLSLISDIQKYQQYLEYIRIQCGRSVGITDTVEGQIGQDEAVRNTQQNLIQTAYILEPYFEMQNVFKRNFLQGLLELAKVVYSGKNSEKLSYVVDDMSMKLLNIDGELLDNSTYGLFVANNTNVNEIKQSIVQLAQAALQNQKIEMSDVIKILRIESITEAEKTLSAAEQRRKEYEQISQQQQQQMMMEEEEKKRVREREKFEEDKEIITLKEKERRETEILKAGILAASFNPEQDKNNNGINDFLELQKTSFNMNLEKENQNLETQKFEHQKEVDGEKIKQNQQKIDNDRKKIQLSLFRKK